MESIWHRVKAQSEENKKSGVPSYDCTKRAIPRMTKDEAIALLNDAIDTIKSYTASIQSIRGYNRDPECASQISINSKYITRCLNEIKLYTRFDDEEFRRTFPSMSLITIFEAIPSLERACKHFIDRGMRYNPPH